MNIYKLKRGRKRKGTSSSRNDDIGMTRGAMRTSEEMGTQIMKARRKGMTTRRKGRNSKTRRQ